MKTFAGFAYSVCATLALCGTFSTSRAEQWVSIGPFGMPLSNHDVVSGQVNALAVDPRDANVIYLGAAEGGVWKTRDGGGSWAPLTDTQLVRQLSPTTRKATMSIGALAIDPGRPQTIYAGTGDPNIACCFFGAGLGVFRSTDGGSTWIATGADPNKVGCANGAIGQAVVNRVVAVPGRQSVIFAATGIGVFRYREDGNDCWIALALANGLPQSGTAIDMVADPYQGALYVAFWGQGIFKSNSLNGNQWQRLGGGLPDASSGFGRIALAFGGRTGVGFSQPLPLVYAGFAFGNQYRLFVTKDGGGQWTELSSPPADGQLGFNNVIAVGSYNSDEVYIGQIAFWRSLDGGRAGGLNDYRPNPPVTDKSWTVLGCCLNQPNPFRKGMDLHGDIHDIVFAPYGSFLPDPSQIEIVYVANDGGITKGSFDSEGVVSWVPLTAGLAIGQAGTIGLDPGNQAVSTAGYWHNGDMLTLSSPSESLLFGWGDGFQTRLDAGNFVIYFNCNAGFDGSICRAFPPPPFNTNFSGDTIWSQTSGGKHWSDPHRPGHLIRLQGGMLFRTTVASTAAASDLIVPGAWTAVDPGPGKTGSTTTMAFRSRALEEQPVYYIGTDTGQIWRGSPEVGWTKLCECGSSVNAIAPDLFRNERIYAVFAGAASPGRVKRLTRFFDGTWHATDIDGTFTPQLVVSAINTIVLDPTLPDTQGTMVYIGTDQGVYRGYLSPPVATALAAGVVVPPIFENWTWRRSPGVPNVAVTELQVHQNFQAGDRSGIIRAATYGRGLYELNRALPAAAADVRPITLTVQAMQVGEDGAPPMLYVEIPVVVDGRRFARRTPFEIVPGKEEEIVLEAPAEIRTKDALLAFAGWALPGGKHASSRRVTLKAEEAMQAVAYYEEAKAIPDPSAKPLRVTASASVRQLCVQNFTHELAVSWEIIDGRRPASTRVEITYPDRHVEIIELKPLQGTQPFPMSYPAGGTLRVRTIATDSTDKPAVAESTLRLAPCTK